MREMVPVGIHGIGIHLPDEIRRNDWWPTAVVDTWRQNDQERHLARAVHERVDPVTDGAAATFEGMARYAEDPFKGAVERRVMPRGTMPSDMEVAAAQDALARAGVEPDEIDLLLVHSQVPDQLTIPNTTRIHHRLGLPGDCFATSLDSACNAFLQQLSFARQWIGAGRGQRALLVQSSALVHLLPAEDPTSPWFGAGATAAVVGPVSAGRGVLGEAHGIDGSMHDALMVGCPDRAWWWEGDHQQFFVKDRSVARRLLLQIADVARLAIERALADAGLGKDDIDFYATHQSSRWFREVTQAHAGLDRARWFDGFPWTGSLASSNVLFSLGMAEREGSLHDGDRVAIHTGGSGMTWSGAVLRWGR